MSLIHGGISGSVPGPGRGFRPGSMVNLGSSDCGWSGLRLL